ncbi:MAG: hypothetical protein ACYTG7_12210 [Planctomycetota bacterium]|jgi:hypothetical protein
MERLIGRFLSERTAFVLLAAGLFAAFIWLLIFTNQKWGDPVVDTGRELEIAWKVSEGKMLYRDMAYNYGPLSPLINALFLKFAGFQLRAFVLSGLFAAWLGVLLVFFACRIFLSRNLSIALCAVFLFECVFQHYYFNGTFNFIMPYSYPAVHGMLAALAAMIFLARFFDGKGRFSLAASGLFVGIGFLCKVEIAAAMAVPLALAPLLKALQERGGMKKIVIDALAWAVPLLAVMLLGFLPFILCASFEKVVWQNVLKPQLVDFRSSAFFLKHLGVAQVQENLVLMARSLLFWALPAGIALLGISIWVRMSEASSKKPVTMRLIICGVLAAIAAIVAWHTLPYEVEFRCLPVIMLIGIIAGLYIVFTRKGSAGSEGWKLFAFALFALLSLVRIFLTSGTFHYGFCLALPGVLVFAILLAHGLPRFLSKWIALPRAFAWYMILLLLLLAAKNFFLVSKPMYDHRTMPIESAVGKMVALPLPFGLNIALAVQFLEEEALPGETLLVLPEGALVNFMTGLANPLYYNLFIPPELNAPGVEEEVIRQIEEYKVDRIMKVQRNVDEYGYRDLGLDYGKKLFAYIEEHYELQTSFGTTPYERKLGGCILYARKKRP